MATLSLSLMGPFTATFNDQPLHNLKTNIVQALLIYLAAERNRPHRRETIFALLWPGIPEKSARHNLSQTLYTLRQAIPDLEDTQGESIPLLLVDRQTVQLNSACSVAVDIHQLDDLLASTQTHSEARLGGHLVGITNARRFSAYLHQFLGEFDQALSCVEEGLNLCHREGYQYRSAGFLVECGVVEAY